MLWVHWHRPVGSDLTPCVCRSDKIPPSLGRYLRAFSCWISGGTARQKSASCGTRPVLRKSDCNGDAEQADRQATAGQPLAVDTPNPDAAILRGTTPRPSPHVRSTDASEHAPWINLSRTSVKSVTSSHPTNAATTSRKRDTHHEQEVLQLSADPKVVRKRAA